jgi:hypothetical protein
LENINPQLLEFNKGSQIFNFLLGVPVQMTPSI